MKKVIIIFTICFSITVLNGQDFSFPQDSASWEYLVRGADAGGQYIISLMTLTLYGDTTINGTPYKLISSVEYCYFPDYALSTTYDFIRTEGDKVYILYRDAAEEVLLYDFGMEVGDTMLVDNCGYPFLDSFIVVQDIGETLVDGAYRKTLSFGQYKWIEGIGNIGDGLLTHSLYATDGLLDPTWYELLCFWQNGEQIFSCDGLIISVAEPYRKEDVKIFPNPTTSMLNISLPNEGKGIQSVRIINLLGEVILQEQYDHVMSVSIDSKNWSPGLYVVVVNGRWVEQVVVE